MGLDEIHTDTPWSRRLQVAADTPPVDCSPLHRSSGDRTFGSHPCSMDLALLATSGSVESRRDAGAEAARMSQCVERKEAELWLGPCHGPRLGGKAVAVVRAEILVELFVEQIEQAIVMSVVKAVHEPPHRVVQIELATERTELPPIGAVIDESACRRARSPDPGNDAAYRRRLD